jgi:Na+-transporting methylmalonyl-CoA/oxaloacetate decarboxylase gamma subunit
MKYKIFLVAALVIFACSILWADPPVNATMSIRQISGNAKIPIRKMIEYLGLDEKVDVNAPLTELNLNDADLQKAVSIYQERKKEYYIGIVVVGMGTVFISLIVVALIIAQLRHIDKKKKTKGRTVPTFSSAGLQTSEEDDIVAAIITSLFLYELEVEENNKLLLTWKRTPLSMWKASNYIPMNEIDPSRRK